MFKMKKSTASDNHSFRKKIATDKTKKRSEKKSLKTQKQRVTCVSQQF